MSNKISNDDSFKDYIGKYVVLTQNGVKKKYIVTEINKSSFLSNVSILQGVSGTDYTFTDSGITQACCTLSGFCFYICNENAVTDDNFEIYLNNTSIGSAILGEDALIGSIFFDAPSSVVSKYTFSALPFSCPLLSMTRYYFDRNLLLENSTNSLSMINRKINFSGNYGVLEMSKVEYCLNNQGSIFLSLTPFSSFTYSGDNGESFSYTFQL